MASSALFDLSESHDVFVKNGPKAYKEFQEANGLKADGVVGSKTWDSLAKYMTGAGSAAAGAEEGASTK